VTLPAFAAERRRRVACSMTGALQDGTHSAPAAIDRCLLLAGRSAANPPVTVAAVDRWDRQTDGRTDGRTPDCYIDSSPHTIIIIIIIIDIFRVA